MPITGNYQDYSKDQLIKELQEVHLELDELHLSWQKEISEKKLAEANLLNRSELFAALNQYAIDLSELEGEMMYQFIVSKFKELFGVRAVWISTYCDKQSELVIEASTASEEDNSLLFKYFGKAVKHFRTPVSEDKYSLMVETGVKSHASLNELSFGQIPDIIGLTLENLLGVGWFQGVSLVNKGKLFGSLVIAGFKNQEQLKTDIVSVFAELTSHILRRKKIEEELKFSEDKFRKAFYTSPDSININRLDDGMYISINNGFTKITGYSEEEVIGKTSLELNIWADPADRDKLVKGLKEKGEVENLEATFKLKNGAVLSGIMSASLIELEGITHILSITRNISERKAVENALKLSENKYRELIELAVDGILIGSPDGTIIGANSYMLSLAGRPLHDMLGMHVSELFDKESLSDSPLRFDLLKKGETIINERNILLPDKTLVPIEMHTKMMPDGTYHSIYHDISERRKAEKALKESEEWFRKLFEQSTDGIFYSSLEGKIVAVNNKFAEIHGYTIEEMKQMKIMDLDCPGTVEHFSDRIELMLKGENLKFEVEHFHKDGHIIPLEVSTGIITMGSENYIMASHRDISESRKAELALRKSEEKLQSIIRVAPVGIGLVSNRILIEVNDYLCNLIGYTRNELIGKSSQILYPSAEEYNRVGKVKYNQISINGTGTIETVFKCKDGSLVNVILSSTPLDKNDHSNGVTFTALDITERIKAADQMNLAKEKAEASDRLKTIFLNNISHEVRTPLNGILGFAELISQEDISLTEKNDAVEMVYESSDRLLKTITNYMDISLLTSGSFSVNLRDSDPSILLNGIYDKYKSVCSNRKIELILKIPDRESSITLRTDPEILEKILTHLVDNAIKFTEKGSILLGYEINREHIEFFVKDTGIGISEKSISRIFERFVKEDIGSDRISEGSGLGLAIVKGMSELIGGTIRVNSVQEKGSAFILTLLLSDLFIDKQTDKTGKSFTLSDMKNTILIAEDDEINFFYMNALLTRETDAIILRAENGRDAIELIKSNSDIKLILMDIKMPEIDGLEATRQIKMINPDIPIIAITAYAMSGDEERILGAGCDGYLSKPISKERLLNKMAEFVTA
jgi:PAS domain S-box-containing protein